MQLAPTQLVLIESEGPESARRPAFGGTGLVQVFGRMPPTALMLLSILSVQLFSCIHADCCNGSFSSVSR